MIDVHLLEQFNADLIEIEKGNTIFDYGSKAQFYYQVKSGEVKMNNVNRDGKEFIQGIFYAGQSFGEPPLFADVAYPAGAEAITDVELYRLPKDIFFELLKQNPDTHLKISEVLASRLYYKAIMASEISSQEPEHRILRLLDYTKKHIHELDSTDVLEVDLTRQQIADLTGLRVETVIRACKALEKKNEIQIKKRKIFR
ncbi:Crp/Fnr family transcriptional regulator [Psychroflexus sediminis]|uniref:cAMP-binding domain of CRP or a regulatory subunit of cAMP-dependent protein kinases n=1 Tax=Psychroflexus sediminis TaxID=470826 RepID=A0A1G7W5S6_9FLAO|nr:Crp/Fnr family transcriptional regulator [Psychroflexus sediminis]SDG67344.1 cAMP-binding domain of CRP or a regulatory subunit of cAMP-dependent protein kinases [Psychroflexus sediminis]